MASVLEASANLPEPGWKLPSPKLGVVEGRKRQGKREQLPRDVTRGDMTQGTARHFALLCGKARQTLGVCSAGCARISGPGNCRSSLLIDSNCRGHKTELFFFLPGTPKGLQVGFPQAPPLSAGSILATQPAPEGLSRVVKMPTVSHFQPCKALVLSRHHLLISETHF